VPVEVIQLHMVCPAFISEQLLCIFPAQFRVTKILSVNSKVKRTCLFFLISFLPIIFSISRVYSQANSPNTRFTVSCEAIGRDTGAVMFRYFAIIQHRFAGIQLSDLSSFTGLAVLFCKIRWAPAYVIADQTGRIIHYDARRPVTRN
jgi:hypothetical protein